MMNPPPNWQIDELSFAGDEHLDPAYVEGYDRKSQFDPTADVQRLKQLGLTATSRLIDFGAGSGTLTEAVAPYCASVIAVDPSPAMNVYLQQRVTQAGLTQVSVVRGGFLTYEHAGEPADFIFTRNALHHLADFWKALALSRLRTMLKPNGIAYIKDLFFNFEPHDTKARLERWITAGVADAALGWTPDELAEHVRKEHSTFSWLFEPILEHCGFEILDREFRGPIYGTYICRAR